MQIDLRLSAEKASYGNVGLSDLAISGRFGGQDSALDINNAQLLGGTLQGSWRRRVGEDGRQSRLDLHLTDVSGTGLSEALGIPGVLPGGTADIDIELAGPTSLRRLLFAGEGRFDARFGAGKLTRLDLGPILEEELGDGFFSLSRLAGNALEYDDATFSGTMRGGVASLDEATINAGRYRIELNGRVPYISNSLALSGRLIAVPVSGLTGEVSADAEARVLTRFFIGGSFSDPFITASRGR